METEKQIKMEGSSSSNPYPYPYPYPSHVTMKLSGRDTYDVWKTQMLCLFESHDMLRFIQLNTLDGCNEDLWKRSDALVKGWILGSLSDQTLKSVVNSFPNKVFTAKDAWDNLQTLYDPVFRADHDRGLEERPMKRVESKIDERMKEKIEEAKKEAERKEAKKIRSAEKLHAAILEQDFGAVKRILNDKFVTLLEEITINGNTALHVAVGTSSNNREFLVKMLDWATKDNHPPLDMQNSKGSTLLHVAAIVGNTEAAKMLVARNQELLYVKDEESQTPVDRALSNMHTDTYMYLLDEYLKTKDVENFDMFDSSEILVNAISSKDYDSAYKMITFVRDPEPVLMAIAQNFPPKVNFLESMSLKVQGFRVKMMDVGSPRIKGWLRNGAWKVKMEENEVFP